MKYACRNGFGTHVRERRDRSLRRREMASTMQLLLRTSVAASAMFAEAHWGPGVFSVCAPGGATATRHGRPAARDQGHVLARHEPRLATAYPHPTKLAAGPAAAPDFISRALPERAVMPISEFPVRSPGWMPRGACQGEDPELFFPIAAAGPALAQVLAAKTVCFRCAVRAACLSYALATGQAGIWGGTTQEERHAIRRSSGPSAREHTASTASASAPALLRGNPGGQ
jgi:WhiB family redox-sensing transcriptional regulator